MRRSMTALLLLACALACAGCAREKREDKRAMEEQMRAQSSKEESNLHRQAAVIQMRIDEMQRVHRTFTAGGDVHNITFFLDGPELALIDESVTSGGTTARNRFYYAGGRLFLYLEQRKSTIETGPGTSTQQMSELNIAYGGGENMLSATKTVDDRKMKVEAEEVSRILQRGRELFAISTSSSFIIDSLSATAIDSLQQGKGAGSVGVRVETANPAATSATAAQMPTQSGKTPGIASPAPAAKTAVKPGTPVKAQPAPAAQTPGRQQAQAPAQKNVKTPAGDASDEGPQRILFQKGSTSADIKGALTAAGTWQYIIWAHNGQVMSVSLPSSDPTVRFELHNDAGRISGRTAKWSGTVPRTGNYVIRLSGNGGAAYTLRTDIQ
jgi:hypothetical protein